MNSRIFVSALVLLSVFLPQLQETDGGIIIGAAIAIKAIIIAKIIAGVALLGAYGRGGLGRPGVGGPGMGGPGGFGFFGRRRREAEDNLMIDRTKIKEEDIEKIFIFMDNNDDQFCVPRIICELHTVKDRSSFGDVQLSIIEVFKNFNASAFRPGSVAYRYKQAADLGSLTNLDTCVRVYSTCTFRRTELMNIVEAANKIES